MSFLFIIHLKQTHSSCSKQEISSVHTEVINNVDGLSRMVNNLPTDSLRQGKKVTSHDSGASRTGSGAAENKLTEVCLCLCCNYVIELYLLSILLSFTVMYYINRH